MRVGEKNVRKRTFKFDGSDGAAEMIAVILKHYADVAFPLGGSDCAAASREALQSIAQNIMQSNQETKPAEISRRQRPMLRSAVKWFYTQSEYAAPNDPLYLSLTDKLA